MRCFDRIVVARCALIGISAAGSGFLGGQRAIFACPSMESARPKTTLLPHLPQFHKCVLAAVFQILPKLCLALFAFFLPFCLFAFCPLRTFASSKQRFGGPPGSQLTKALQWCFASARAAGKRLAEVDAIAPSKVWDTRGRTLLCCCGLAQASRRSRIRRWRKDNSGSPGTSEIPARSAE